MWAPTTPLQPSGAGPDSVPSYKSGKQWTRTTPFRTRFTVWLLNPIGFCPPLLYTLQGSNLRHLACKASALPTELKVQWPVFPGCTARIFLCAIKDSLALPFCDPGGLRSHSLPLKRRRLSRLSYEIILFVTFHI